jgi:biotin carboxylase
MTTHKNLIVVGGGPGLCDRARQLGAKITLVDTPGASDAALIASVHRAIFSDYEDDAMLLPALQAIHSKEPFSAVLAMTELALLPAARIAAALGLGGVSPAAVERTRDKLLMRDWLRCHGFSTVACERVHSAEEIRRFGDAHGYPIIVKPRSGQGSQRIMCFKVADDIGAPTLDDHEYIAESFLDGKEFSVEAFSFGGRHLIAAVTGKFTNDDDDNNPFVEIGHVIPAPIGAATRAQIEAYVQRFLVAMELTDGCTHTEIRLTRNGPEVIETHTRVGGDSIPTLVRQATGCDLLDLAVQWPLGLVTAADTLTELRVDTPCGAAAIRFFTPPPGKIRTITGTHRWRGRPGILALHLPLKEGDTIGKTSDSFTRHGGYVIATGDTAQRAIHLCDEVIGGVTIEVEPA